jgi:site-specific recombinase XerD
MRRKTKVKRNSNQPKIVLRLPDLERAKSAVLNSLTSNEGRRSYCHAIDEFVDWYCSEPRLAFNRTVVLRYRSYLEERRLAPGTVNLRLAVVRRLAYEASDCGLLSADLAAGIRRVHGIRKIGVRLGNWLNAEEGMALWQSPDPERMKGKRDRALLTLLLACGLRRQEAVGLRLRDLEQVSFAGRWGFGCTDEVVGFLDEVFEAVRKVRRGDGFVLHKRNSEVRQVNME